MSPTSQFLNQASQFLNQASGFLKQAADWIWGPWMLILLFGTHLFLTFRLRFIQRYIGKAIRLSFERHAEGKGDISHFGALMTALAATIGTGNIVGVATAVSLGGPGAVFWMWLTGVFGIATKYSEALLAVRYRVFSADGLAAGGPMYVLDRGLKMRPLAVLFAVFTAIAAFGIGNMVQANSISTMLAEPMRVPAALANLGVRAETVSVPTWVTAIVMTGLTAAVILGGIRSIARVCGYLVPFMAVCYVLGCLTLLAMKASTLPETVCLICKSAFSGHAALGGFLGAGIRETLRYGVARGLFSNESGLGSAPIVAAAAQTKNPVRQALVSSTGTFWDTVVVCLLTGLVLVNSGAWHHGSTGAPLTAAAFSELPVVGPAVLTIGLLTFVFSTILGWSYYGEKACEYLFGARSVLPYRALWVIAVAVGSVSTLQSVWNFADIANGLMAIPNLIALLLLSGVVVSQTRQYLWEGSLDHPESLSPPTGDP